MIGSVQFSKPGDAARNAAATSSSAFQPGISSRPALDNVMASARGQALLDSQVDSRPLMSQLFLVSV